MRPIRFVQSNKQAKVNNRSDPWFISQLCVFVLVVGLFRVSAECPALELDHAGVGGGGAEGPQGLPVHSHPSGPGAPAVCGHLLPATVACLHLRDFPHFWYYTPFLLIFKGCYGGVPLAVWKQHGFCSVHLIIFAEILHSRQATFIHSVTPVTVLVKLLAEKPANGMPT